LILNTTFETHPPSKPPGHTTRQKLLIATWVALIILNVLFVLLLLLPFFAMGIYQMPDSQIWSSPIDISWHPYYSNMRESLYVRAGPIIVLWYFVGNGLLVFLLLELLLRWRKRNLQATLVRLALLVFPVLTLVTWLLVREKLLNWVMD
jgi:hypothetical protein